MKRRNSNCGFFFFMFTEQPEEMLNAFRHSAENTDCRLCCLIVLHCVALVLLWMTSVVCNECHQLSNFRVSHAVIQYVQKDFQTQPVLFAVPHDLFSAERIHMFLPFVC